LLAYKQEQYIREAVEGAFSQTYSPLEIILSDDCSPDRTFDIIQEMAAKYTGPHKVVLNRNPQNFGIGAHVNRIMELTHGELIVAAAGDDVSLPNRCELIQKRWTAASRPVAVIYSDVIQMTADGRYFEENRRDPQESEARTVIDGLKGYQSPVIGCSECWHRELFLFFGAIAIDVMNEDDVIWFRAALLGKVLHVNELLVRHRLHGNNTGSWGMDTKLKVEEWLHSREEVYRRQIAVRQNFLTDLERLKNSGSLCRDLGEIKAFIEQDLNFNRSCYGLCRAKNVRKFKYVLSYLRNMTGMNDFKWLTYLMFPDFYLWIKKGRNPRRSSYE